MRTSEEAAGYVEMRIHGVSGTPPQQLLDWPMVRRFRADGPSRTGFYQRVDAAGAPLPGDLGQQLESFNWGQLTSGSVRSALWMLSLPFGLVNAAHFMLPAPTTGGGRWWRNGAEGCLRALGVLLTITLTVALGEFTLDQIVWQWMHLEPQPACVSSACTSAWLSVAMVVTALFVPLVIALGGRSRAVRSAGPAPAPPTGGNKRYGFRSEEFLVGDSDTRRLQFLHGAASLAVVGTLGARLAAENDIDLGAHVGGAAWLRAILDQYGTTQCSILLGSIVAVVALTGNPLRSRPSRDLWWSVVNVVFVVVSLVSSGLAVWTTWLLRSPGPGPFPGISGLAVDLMIVAFAGLVLLVVCTAFLAACTRGGSEDPVKRYLWGMGAAVVAPLGVFIGVGFAAAAAYSINRVLPERASDPILPSVLARIAHAWGLTAIEFGAVGIVGVGWWLVTRREFGRRVRRAQQTLYGTTDDVLAAPAAGETEAAAERLRALTRTVRNGWFFAGIKLKIEYLMLVFSACGLLFTVLGAVGVVGSPWTSDSSAAWWSDRFGSTFRWINDAPWRVFIPGPANDPGVLVAVGSFVLVAGGGALLALGRSALFSRAKRRSVNVVWDVIAFWPRAAHPLVPPPYTARAIRALTERLRTHVQAGRPVVIAAHSQGSLLTVAALTRLLAEPARSATEPSGADIVGRVAFLSFGSQLQFAYSRAFPAYVNRDVLGTVLEGLSDLPDGGLVATADRHPDTGIEKAWISLVRETDPIGGQVFSTDRWGDPSGPLRSRRWSLTGRSTGAALSEPTDDIIRVNTEVVAGDRRLRTVVRCCGREFVCLDPALNDDAPDPGKPLGHSAYFRDTSWNLAVRYLAGEVPEPWRA